MRRFIILSVLFFTYGISVAQQDTTEVLNALIKLEKALVEKNIDDLEKLLHPNLAYGHSNTWVQTKKDVLADLERGYTVYKSIDNRSLSISQDKKYASVKERILVGGSANGKDFSLNLFVLYMWVKTKKGWQLLSRQGIKV